MSLLLDALKKSGEKSHPGGSSLTLEDLPPPRTGSESSAPAPARAAGEKLFAAKKKKPASFHWKLGLVPTTLIIALVFGSGYGYYVWLQLQPPSTQRVVQRPVPPSPKPAPAPAAPVSIATAPLVPLPPAAEEPVVPQHEQPVVAARAENVEVTHKPRATKPRSRSTTAGVALERKTEADNVTPALLDAYQAYQRGDYVTATQGYRAVLSRDAHNRDALLGLAAIAQQQGQDQTAQQYYRQLLVLDPRDPAAQAAMAAYSPEDEGNTESRLKMLLAEQPRSSTLQFAMGNYYAGQSSWGDAQQYYFNAHTLEPSNAQFAFNLAVSLDHLGQRKLAAQYYQRALQLDVSGHSGFDHVQVQQRLNELTAAR